MSTLEYKINSCDLLAQHEFINTYVETGSLTLFDTKFEWQGSSLGCCILKPRPPFDLRPLAALQQKGAATYLLEACQDRGSC